MEQTVQHKHVRPTIEEVVYSPKLQCERYLRFVDTVLIEHGGEISELDLQEIGAKAFNINARALLLMHRKRLENEETKNRKNP